MWIIVRVIVNTHIPTTQDLLDPLNVEASFNKTISNTWRYMAAAKLCLLAEIQSYVIPIEAQEQGHRILISA